MKTWKILQVAILMLCLLTYSVAVALRSATVVNIQSTSVELTISGNTAYCYGGVWAYSPDNSCTIRMKLQKRDGSRWTTLKTWSGDGTGSTTMNETFTISSGTYRVSVSGKVDGESYGVTTRTKTMK